ncbi:MAG TPA: hypothetical protein VGY96_20605 [Streptosporangiaceae bacterium]|nr:hypothetical protein [Streptosporangiaceae bacterium]
MYRGEGGSRGLGVGIGVAITAWLLGFRHAFDADHISCIDNTTRKLMADGKRPLATGFFFSFGHSTVIVAVGVGITVAARAVFGAIVDPNSAYETAGGAVGTLLSAGFLYLIALLNLIVLAGIFKVFREMRSGAYDEVQLEAQLQARGLMYRFFGRFMKSVNHTLAALLRGPRLRHRVRHRHRGRAARRHGLRRDPGPALLRRACAAVPVLRRHDAVRHARRGLHELRLRRGLRPGPVLRPAPRS